MIVSSILVVVVVLLPTELVRPGGHAQVLGHRRLVVALGTRDRLVLLVLESLALHMLVAVAGLATETRVLTQAIARETLEVLRLQDLARGLVLKLVVFAEECIAEAAPEHPPSVIPNATFAFHANGVLEWTGARMHLQALAAVTYPGLAKVADGSNHPQAGLEDSSMLNEAVPGLQHALDLATLGADGQPLHTLTEIAKGTGLLLPGRTKRVRKRSS